MKISPINLLFLELSSDPCPDAHVSWNDWLNGRVCHTEWVSVEHFWWMASNMRKMGLTTVLYRVSDWDYETLFDFCDHQEETFCGELTVTAFTPLEDSLGSEPYIVVKTV